MMSRNRQLQNKTKKICGELEDGYVGCMRIVRSDQDKEGKVCSDSCRRDQKVYLENFK